MRVIGITGGVGSGKSRILEILKEDYGAEIIIADEISHMLMKKGRPAYTEVVSLLGENILADSGEIDRNKMAKLVFKDDSLLKKVNEIIHPLVWECIRKKIKAKDSGIIVIEAALMKKEQSDFFDEIWYVYTSKEERIKRLMQNRGYSMQKCLDIMNKQLSDEEFRTFCTHELNNNGSLSDIRLQIDVLMSK